MACVWLRREKGQYFRFLNRSSSSASFYNYLLNMLVYVKHLKEGKKAALAPSSFSMKTTARVLTGPNCCVCCYMDIWLQKLYRDPKSIHAGHWTGVLLSTKQHRIWTSAQKVKDTISCYSFPCHLVPQWNFDLRMLLPHILKTFEGVSIDLQDGFI